MSISRWWTLSWVLSDRRGQMVDTMAGDTEATVLFYRHLEGDALLHNCLL